MISTRTVFLAMIYWTFWFGVSWTVGASVRHLYSQYIPPGYDVLYALIAGGTIGGMVGANLAITPHYIRYTNLF